MPEVEIWKDIKGFEGFYKVSNTGNIYSVKRRDSRGIKIGGLTLKPTCCKDGYLKVVLNKNGMRYYKRLHRLVAETFIPNPNNFPQVNHIDEIKDNNNVKNLEWCTSRYNNNYGTRIERSARTKSKKIRAVNVETGEVLTFNSGVEAIREGYSGGNVSAACRGVYRHDRGNLIGGDGHIYKGYRWSYE